MRSLVIAAALLMLLAACKEGPEGPAWYENGNANYDALRTAADACKEKGGDFQLKPGGDPTHLGDYACNPKKGS